MAIQPMNRHAIVSIKSGRLLVTNYASGVMRYNDKAGKRSSVRASKEYLKHYGIYFKKVSATSEVHLGIAYLRYETKENAQKTTAQIEQKVFFENTKILTRYVITNIDTQNVIVYTESAANKMILDYLDIASNKLKK